MHLRRKADFLLTYLLQTDWRQNARRWFWRGQTGLRRSWRRLRHLRWRDIDVRKPVHAVVIGVTLAAIVAPISAWINDNERYRIDGEVASVVTKPAPHLKDKLIYEQAKQASVFNVDGQEKVGAEAKDVLTTRVGGGEKKTTQLYTATFPDLAAKGIVVNDNVNKVAVTFTPLFGVLGGRNAGGQVVYPLSGQNGALVYTPKANAVKEDVVLNSAPGDTAEYQYRLQVPDSLEARLDDDGSIGVYSGDQQLFGNISFGTDKDRDLVEKARREAKKTTLMFRIPAPTIAQSPGGKSEPTARFALDGDMLTVHVKGLAGAAYPLSIDPTFYIASTADFLLGSSDDNVDLSVANQVGRAALSGGSLAAWSQNTCAGTNTNLDRNNFSFGLTAYNGYLYELGGGNTASNSVAYADINLTTGAVGCNTTFASTVTPTTPGFTTARVGTQAFGYNGYLYVVGGEDSTGATIYNTTEYAKLTSTGGIAANSGCGTAWCTGTNLTTARAYFASALYQGVIYVFGGSTNDNPNLNAAMTNSVEWARVNGDGSLGTWNTNATTLTSARDRFSAAAYNGYVYAAGGLTNATTTVASVEYAPINADGSLGAWTSTTSFPTARRDFGFATERGYMYVYGGCSTGLGVGTSCTNFLGDSQYAVINADGTIGLWQQTQNTAGKRGNTDSMATTFYNGYLYSAGGCGSENTNSNNCKTAGRTNFLGFTSVDATGRFDGLTGQATAPYNPTASSVARFGGQVVALNGYVYYISGCSTTTGSAYTPNVDYAAIGTDGSLGAWSTTTALPAQAGDNAGRFGFTAVAYNNKIFVLGGLEIPTAGGNDTQLTSVISNTQNTNGTLSGSWSNETSMPATQFFHTTVVWNNMIYVMGGRDTGATPHSETYYATIGSGGTIGSWTTSSATGFTARWGHSSVIYGNYIYLLGGSTNTTGTITTGTQRSQLSSAGVPGNWTSDTAMPAGVMYGRAMIHNDFLYVFGGSNSSGTTQTAIYRAAITPSTGVIGTWSSTNIGANAYNGTNGLAFARGGAAGVAVDGYLYLLGGCHAGMTVSGLGYDSCTTIVTNTSTTETEVYLVDNGGTGQTGAWSATGITALTSKADAALVAYNGYLYSIGGCTGYTSGACTGSGQYTNEVKFAAIAKNGTVGAWTASANTLATPTMLLQAAAYNGYLYVLGGKTNASGAVNTVSYAAILSTGDIGTWSSGSTLITGRRNFGAAISSGYIYAVGGEDSTGTELATTEYALIDATTGNVGSWTATSGGSNFTTARSAMGVTAYNGVLYVVGGCSVFSSGVCTTVLTDIQYAALNSSNGSVGTWANTIQVPRGMSGRQTVAANGYMYFIGNEGTKTEVSYAAISSNGTLGALHDQPNALAGTHAHGSAAIFNGMLYVYGDCTLSAGTCTLSGAGEKAGQLAISRASHYSKLWDTQGIDTAPSQLVLNGTLSGPGSVVSTILRTSSTFDTTLGIAQVIKPTVFNTYYRVYPLNSSGVNMGVAKTYALVIILDDTQAGTFPDINASGSQTAVSSITLYYHANPSRRLRHGASFSNVGCNITPANGCILDTAP